MLIEKHIIPDYVEKYLKSIKKPKELCVFPLKKISQVYRKENHN
jgi:hypothetical protein